MYRGVLVRSGGGGDPAGQPAGVRGRAAREPVPGAVEPQQAAVWRGGDAAGGGAGVGAGERLQHGGAGGAGGDDEEPGHDEL